jgi:NADPH:quinone reductase-like Zn-dependent oxidoreductase
MCEYARVPAQLVVPRAPNVKVTEAAGLGLAGCTAYHALFHVLKVEPGQSVFVNGGSTAVGMFAIQLAKAIGCTVTVTASEKREEVLRSLGADHVRKLPRLPVLHSRTERPVRSSLTTRRLLCMSN